MEISGIQLIAAPRTDVWNALNDPAVLLKCLPGCESVERSEANEFKVIVRSAIGPLKARFNGILRLTEIQAPSSCVMVFEGQGGAVGFGKGASSVTLSETEAGTEVAYSATAQVGGKLAQVGSRLIDSVARKMSDDFFKAFHRQFAEPQVPVSTVEPGNDIPAIAAAKSSDASPASQGRAASSADARASHTQDPAGRTGTLVPGWWLVVAVVLGAAAAIAGALLVR